MEPIDPAKFDPFILGQKPLANLTCMQRANEDLTKINGRTVEELTTAIKTALESHQNPRESLYKKVYYASLAILFALAAVTLVDSWIWHVHKTRLITDNAFQITYGVILVFSLVFQHLHENAINTRKKKTLAEKLHWVKEHVAIETWLHHRNQCQERLQVVANRAQALLSSGGPDDDQKRAIQASMATVTAAQQAVADKITMLNALPEFAKWMLFRTDCDTCSNQLLSLKALPKFPVV